MVYLDYNATAPLVPSARAAMLPFLDGSCGNPSSIHTVGRCARASVDDSRDRISALLGVRSHEIIFTGGGTESCNLGVIGLARAHVPSGKHLITSAIEHHAVLHAFEYLSHFEGFDVSVLPVDGSGIVDPEALVRAIRPETTLVSVMHANNETGAIQPVAELAAICRQRGVLFHSDAVQTFGKIPVRPQELGVSAMSIAAHKIGGPQGVGVLYVGAGVAIARTSYGGAQENTRRPGTENVAGIAGFAAAAESAVGQSSNECLRLSSLRDELWLSIRQSCENAVRNGDPARMLSNTLNVSFPGADGEALLIGLDLEGVCVSSGSACMVGSIQPSHVLLAMGVTSHAALATVRFSLGASTCHAGIEQAAKSMLRVIGLQSPPVL